MKMLLDERNKILFITSFAEYGVWDEPNVNKWKIGANEYTLDNNYSVAEVDEVPIDVIPGKYFFIDGSFVTNPNFINKDGLERKIDDLGNGIADVENAMCESELLTDERIGAIEDAICEISMLLQ